MQVYICSFSLTFTMEDSCITHHECHLVWQYQTPYALATVSFAWPAHATSCNYNCSTNQITVFSKLAFLACNIYEDNIRQTYCNQYFHSETAKKGARRRQSWFSKCFLLPNDAFCNLP